MRGTAGAAARAIRRSTLMDILRGSRSQRVLWLNHDELGVYGIGKNHSRSGAISSAHYFTRACLPKRKTDTGDTQGKMLFLP